MNEHTNPLIISHLTLRAIIGALGFFFPVVLVLACIAYGGCTGIEDSISSYFYTGARDIFVGVLFVIGFFLFSYKGYDNDNIVANLGGVFALGVALMPAHSDYTAVRIIHFSSAALLFAVFAYFSLVLFRKGSNKGVQSKDKDRRNKVYLVCGVLIAVFILCIALAKLLMSEEVMDRINLVFWLETLALWAFGVSWVTKGKVFGRKAVA